MEDDDLLDPFASEEFRSVVGTPEDQYAPDKYREGAAWSDYAKSTGSRVAGIGADLSATLRTLGESDEDPDSKSARAVTALGKFGQALFTKIEEDVAGSMTETSQRDLASTFSDPNFWSLNALALKATNMAPDIAVAVIPATRLSGSMLAAATATQGGVLSASSVVDDLYKATDAMTDEELSAEVPLYKELRDSGLSEEAARRNYNSVLRGQRPLIVGAISALTAGLSPGGQAARLTSQIAQGVPSEVAEGVAKRVVKGVAEGVASEGAQEGSEDYFTQEGRVAGGLQQAIDIPQVVESALTGAVVGGVLGGGISAVPRPRVANQPVDNSDIDLTLTDPTTVPDSTDANPPLEPVPGVDSKATPGVVTPDEVVMNTGATTAQNMQAIKNFNKQYANLTPEQQQIVDDNLPSRRLPVNKDARKKVAPSTVVEPVQAAAPDAAQTMAITQAKPPEPVTTDIVPPVAQPVQEPVAQPVQEPVAQPVVEPVVQPVQEIPVETNVPVEVVPVPTPVEETSPAPTVAEIDPVQPVSIPQPVEQITGPRVLPDLTKVDEERAIARQAERTVADNIKAMETPPAEPTGAKLSKAQISQRDNTRTAALDIASRHMPVEAENKLFSPKPVEQVEAMRQIKKRVDAIVNEAEAQGVVLPKSFKDTTDKAQQYNPETLLLMEAKRLARLPKAGIKDYRRFATREFDLRAGALEEVLADRREEGDRANRKGTGVDEERTAGLDEDTPVLEDTDEDVASDEVEAAVTVPSPEDEVIAREEEETRQIRERTARQIAKDTVPKSIEKALDEAMEAYTVPKADRKVPVVAKKRKVVIPPKAPPAPVTPEGNTPRPNLAERIKAAREKTNTAPTEAQKSAGNYAKGTVTVQGVPVAIENPKGSQRKGMSDGKHWSVKLKHDYGYVKGSKGVDGDQVDVYVGPMPDSPNVFVIDQLNLSDNSFDEHKVMMGFKDEQAAVRAYDAAFSDDMGILRIGNITRMTVDEFKTWLDKPVNQRKTQSQQYANEARSLLISARLEEDIQKEAKNTGNVREGFLMDEVTKRVGRVLQSTTGQELLWKQKFDHLSGAERVIAGTMRTKLTQLVGNTPVYILDASDIRRLTGREPGERAPFGYHMDLGGGKDYIVLNADIMADRKLVSYTLLHEMTHAATVKALKDKPELRQIIGEIARAADVSIQQMDQQSRDVSAYAYTNVAEFIAEVSSNPKFQRVLAEIPVTKKMAQQLGLDAGVQTMWDAFITAVRRAIGLPKNTHSMLEAALRATEFSMRPREAAIDLESGEHNLLRSFLDGNQKGVKRAVTDILKQVTDRPDLAPTQGNPHLMGLRTLDSIARGADRYFQGNPIVRTIANIIEGQRVAAIKEVDKAAPIIQKLHDLEKKYRGQVWEDFSSLVHDETMSGVFADRPLSDQKHISKQGARDSWARKQHPDLSARYAKLPADLKSARKEAMEFFTAKQNEMALKLIRNRIVTLFDTPDPDGLAQRIHENKVTDADRELMGEAYDAIAAAGALGKVDGPYVPLMRRGNFVVKGKLKVTSPGNNATTISGNEFEFKSKDDATKFMESQAGRPTMRTIYVDKTTGSRTGTENGKSAKLTAEDMNAEARYRVVVQDRHMEMFDTMKEARARVAELRAMGMDVDDAVPRQFENYGIQADALSTQMRRMNTILERKADDRGYTAEQKSDLMNTLNEMSINLLGATRIQSRNLPRRYVAGASKDFVRNTTEYAHAAGNYIAKLDHRPRLDKALSEMADLVRANPSDGFASGRTTIQNEILRRVSGSNPISENKGWNAVTSRVLAMSFIDKLMSPSYAVINATQPMMLSAPYLSAHYGAMRAFKALGSAYSDIGSLKSIKEGFTATVQKASKGDQIPTDPVSLIRARLKNAGERELLDILVERGTIDTDSGLEVSAIVRSTKGILGKLDGGIGYLEGIARQMPKTIEAINRSTVAIAAYRLEMERSGDKARAVQFAQDTLNLTQFNYSASNSAPIMNHPALRLALQFKKYGISMYQFLGEQSAIMLDKTRSREERVAAIKALSYTIGMHVLVAGAMGLPTEPIKMIVTAANGLGITDWTWGDVEDAQRRAMADLFGAQFGEIVSRGVPRALGIDLSTRMGIDTLMGPLGEPRSNEAQDWKAYLWDSVAGAPAGLVTDWARGINDLAEGDITRAMERLVPIKAFSDSIKAYRTMTEGTVSEKTGKQVMSPYTPGEAVVRALGFSPAREAESFERSSTYYRNKESYEADVSEFKRAWVEASPGARGRVWVDIQKWNRKQPVEARIKLSELRRYQRKLKDDMKNTKEGILARRRDQRMLEKVDATYNFER